MMLRRKATEQLERWKAEGAAQALLVTGARQVGKTYLIEEFGRAHYRHFIHLDFIERPDLLAAVRKAHSAEDLYMTLSAYAGTEMIPNETLIFIDEVQECLEVLTLIKYLLQKSEFDYILSGSLLGVELRNVRSLPVGYLRILEMYPLDFEEFCWANGVGTDIMPMVRERFLDRKPVIDGVHERLLDLFHRYLMVGGMPAVVDRFVASPDLAAVKAIQQDILDLYRLDISKYATSDQLAIKEIFDAIPSQLDSQSKRFSFSSVGKNGTYERYENDFLWLIDAGVVLPVRNVREPRHPLKLAESRKLFKLFMCDTGLLSAACGIQVVRSILSDELGVNYGSIYENAVAQELHAHGFDLFYFRNKKLGEIDFVLERADGAIVPVEVKSGKDYKRHNALRNVLETPNYAIDEALVLCERNLRVEGKIVYCPVYMVDCLRR